MLMRKNKAVLFLVGVMGMLSCVAAQKGDSPATEIKN
jgi:hypothetical protein